MLKSREMEIVENDLDFSSCEDSFNFEWVDPIKGQKVWFPNQGCYSLNCSLSMYGIKPYFKFRPNIIYKPLWRKILDFVCTDKNWGE